MSFAIEDLQRLKAPGYLEATKNFIEQNYKRYLKSGFWREGKGYRTHCPCPSHNDREPSFFLYVDYKGKIPQVRMSCFGNCKFPRKNFDVFDLVQWMENCSLPVAYRKVESFMQGCPVNPDTHLEENQESAAPNQNDLYRIYHRAAIYYHHILLSCPNQEVQKAREELRARGITSRVIRKYRLGYVPKLGSRVRGLSWYFKDSFVTSWPVYDKSGLFRYLGKGYLTGYINKGHYLNPPACCYGDHLSRRISIPVMNDRGQVVGILGRKVGKCSKNKRYRATRGCPKGEILFGFHQNYQYFEHEIHPPAGRDERGYRRRTIYVVEGPFDVLMADSALGSSQRGCPFVATLGGPLSKGQVELLAEHAQKLQQPTIILFFDGGEEEFILQSYKALQENPVTRDLPVGFKLLPQGVDPATFYSNPMMGVGRREAEKNELSKRLSSVYTVSLPLPDYKGLVELVARGKDDCSKRPYRVEKEKLIHLLHQEKKGLNRYEVNNYCERIATFIRHSRPAPGAEVVEIPTIFLAPEVIHKAGAALTLLLDIWVQQQEKRRSIKVSVDRQMHRLGISRRTYFKYQRILTELGFLKKRNNNLRVIYSPRKLNIKITTQENTKYMRLEEMNFPNLPPTGTNSVPHIL